MVKLNREKLLIGDTRLWVIGLIASIFVVIFALWFAYIEHQRSLNTAEEPRIATVWGFIESDSFKALIALLVVPIFVFLFERRFKIFENYEANVREKIAQRIRENRENRLKTIDTSHSAWNNLYKLTTEIAYFDMSSIDGSKSPHTRILELLQKGEVYGNETEDMVNEWTYRFQNLSDAEVSILVSFINVLLNPAATVAHYIRDEIVSSKPDTNGIKKMQCALLVIQNAVKFMYHHPMLMVLKDSTEMLTIIEENIPEHDIVLSSSKLDDLVVKLSPAEKNRVDELRKKIEENVSSLHNHDRNLLETLSKGKLALAVAGGNEVGIKEYRDAYSETLELLAEKGLTAEYVASKEFINLKKAYYSISQELRFRTFEYPISKKGVIDFADWCNINTTMWRAGNEASHKKAVYPPKPKSPDN